LSIEYFTFHHSYPKVKMPMLTSTYPTIAIIGAGIGGLTAAMQLHANGITNVHVFESADQLVALGVGINVQPHAILVLRNLGLLPALEDTGVLTKELNYYNRHGDEILIEPRGKDAGYKVPQLSIHRGEFQILLLDAARERLGEANIHLNHTFTKFEQDEGGSTITAHFVKRVSNEPADVPKIVADAVIAADGINSTARRILYPDEGPAQFSGRMLWRGCIEREPYLSGASMVWGGHADQKFIAYPISSKSQRRGKSLVNWICELRVRDANDKDKAPPKSDWLASVPKERFAPPFKGWKMGGLDVTDLINQTEKIYEFPMCDRNPVDRWSFGRLTLLGDAAHPMYPSKIY
jgi:2-polyprenyl-6-methoxyphenol hydroxylase-like FAD-dependent oxidoreductase